MVYWSGNATPARLAAGTSGYLLQGNGAAAPTWINATNSNTASTIVKRDGSGNFSAGTITSLLTSNRTATGDYITIQSNGTAVGKISLNTRGTTSAEGWVSLTLGNASAATVAENASGRIYLYSRTTSLQIEAAYGAFNSSVTGTGTSSIYYLNLYGNIYASSNILSSHHSLIQSNSTKARYGDFEITTSGTTSVEGKASLKLGNARAKGTAENATGQILLYHSDGGASTISAAFDSIATTTKAVKIDTGLSVVNSIETTTGYIYARAGSIWAGTTASTTGERDVGARAGSGNFYLYANATTTGTRGLYGTNAAGTGKQILTINQDNYISALTNLVTPIVLNSGSQITFNERGGQAIYAGPNDAANNPGGALNNLVISSWYGVSFTTALTGQTYSGKNAVSINCRTGDLVAGGKVASYGPGERYCEAQNSTYGNRLCLDVQANGQTAGIYSSGYVNSSGAYTADGKWLIYRNVNNATVIGDSLWTSGNIYPGGTGSWYFGSNGAIQGWIMDLVAITPYIDFHYNNSAADYTFRILHDTSDRLVFQTAGISTYCTIVNNSSESTMGAWSGSNAVYLYNKGERGLYTNGAGKICYTDTSNKITVRYHTLSNLSSLRIKENIYPISDNDALSLLHINPVYFNYKKGYGSQEKTIGVIAEEVERFVRYIVTEDEDPINPTLKLKGVSYDKFIPYLIKLAQIQQREITNLKSQIQEYMESNAQN